MNSPLILVDISNLAWRSHWAFMNLTHEGKSTGVLFGFLKAVLNLRKISPRLLFLFDNGIPGGPNPAPVRSWRKDFFPEYKANRIHDNESFTAVMGQLHLIGTKLIPWLGYASIGYPGMEADDLIGIFSQGKDPVRIYSTDRDFYQCLTPDGRVVILVPGKHENNGPKWVMHSDVVREYGITPEQWAAYLALGGDSSDGIKPAKGMGPKTAISLVKQGCDPTRAWDSQVAIPDKYSGAVWEKVQAAYKVAKLPRSFAELPASVTQGIDAYALSMQIARFQFRLQNTQPTAFERFCADWGLLDALANRREFFR